VHNFLPCSAWTVCRAVQRDDGQCYLVERRFSETIARACGIERGSVADKLLVYHLEEVALVGQRHAAPGVATLQQIEQLLVQRELIPCASRAAAHAGC
jgi:hypothetical protein